jgi:hypothetical protein
VSSPGGTPRLLAPSLGSRTRPWPVLLALSFFTGHLGCNNLSPDASASGPSNQDALTREGHRGYFPIETGQKHADTQCGECHEDPTSFSVFTCVSCHAHDEAAAIKRHEFITGFQWRSNACFNCHPTGWEAPILPADHSLKYFPIQSGSHDTLLCIDCHTSPSTAKTFTCTSCHDQTAAGAQHMRVADYAWSDAGCYRCHPQD